MDISAWDRPGPVAHAGYANPLPDTPSRRHAFMDRPVRGERIGSWRMLLGTYVLQAVAAAGLVTTVVWILGVV